MKIYFIIAALLILGIVQAAATAQDNSEPSTGTLIVDNWRSGQGELTVTNGASLDAVVILQYYKGPTYLAVFVRNGESFTLGGIQDGNYDVYYALGRNWDRESNKFRSDQVFLRLNRSMIFNTGWNPIEYHTKNVLSINSPIPDDHGLDSTQGPFGNKWIKTGYPISGQIWNEENFPNLFSSN